MVGFSIARRPVKISTCRFHETMRLLGPFGKVIFDLSYDDLEGSGQGHETKNYRKWLIAVKRLVVALGWL